MGEGWRLPNISELRTLFRSGEEAEHCQSIEWDMSWPNEDMNPDDYCGVWDPGCLSRYSPVECYDVDLCSPSECGELGGPGKGLPPESDGCYWDAALSGTCGGASTKFYYYSVSEVADDNLKAWVVSFYSGVVNRRSKAAGNDTMVRCVAGPFSVE